MDKVNHGKTPASVLENHALKRTKTNNRST